MRRLISLLLFLSMSGLMTLQRTQVADSAGPDYDIIIRNGRVVDGSGRAGFNTDIAIKDDHIARIGRRRLGGCNVAHRDQNKGKDAHGDRDKCI